MLITSGRPNIDIWLNGLRYVNFPNPCKNKNSCGRCFLKGLFLRVKLQWGPRPVNGPFLVCKRRADSGNPSIVLTSSDVPVGRAGPVVEGIYIKEELSHDLL